MIKHIVMYKLKNFENKDIKQEKLIEIKSKLENLKKTISEIKYFEVGLNYNKILCAYDLVLISEFASKEDLQTYTIHPDHLIVIEFVGPIVEDRKVVDFEC